MHHECFNYIKYMAPCMQNALEPKSKLIYLYSSTGGVSLEWLSKQTGEKNSSPFLGLRGRGTQLPI